MFVFWVRVAALVLLGSLTTALPQTVTIKMGTLAPEGTHWHQIFLQMREQWRKISGGKVQLQVFPGGAQGDEAQMVRLLRIGQLQAAALTSDGLGHIDRSGRAWQLPMMFDSWEELDYVHERIAPRLEKIIESKGFVVLNWGDVGWVHFFSKTPVSRLDDLRKLKLFCWAGDNETLELYKAHGFKPVPLESTAILMGLQTGLIDAFGFPPLAALSQQLFGPAKNMIDLNWVPLIGATVISKPAWERIPEAYRGEMLQAARDSGKYLRAEIRKLGDDAVAAMQKRGLNVVKLDAATLADWRREHEAAYPRLRGKFVPADLFDEVKRYRDEFRANALGRP